MTGILQCLAASPWILASQLLGAQETVSCSAASPTQTICRIDKPTVTRRSTEYPQIPFQPNDHVTVSAGGCVQTGGVGDTWKRYLNPSGPNSSRLYHGLIGIPGVTPPGQLVRIQNLVGQDVAVPSGVPSVAQHLRLGYEDDEYGDNGYYDHDDGTENQCARGGPAFVTVRIDRSSTPFAPPPVRPPASGLPLNLAWDRVDENVLPLNPKWVWQDTHAGAPDAVQLCGGFSVVPGTSLLGTPPCTDQPISVDIGDAVNSFFCNVGGTSGRLSGHVNWMPATFEGVLRWSDKSAVGRDDDYNLRLTTPNESAPDLASLTTANGSSIILEFDSDETIDHFHTDWWSLFHHAVDAGDNLARYMIDGSEAVVIGLMGLDVEHSAHSELHPVYALAIHIRDDPADDRWAIFVRNWGNEGYCSQQNHLIDLQSVVLHIHRPGAAAVDPVWKQFLTNSTEVAGPDVHLVKDEGALIIFQLPSPERGARVNGEIRLVWTISGPTRAPLRPSRLAERRIRRDAGRAGEELLGRIVEQASPSQQALIASRVKRPVEFDEYPPRPLTAIKYPRPGRPPRVRAIPDSRGAERKRRAHAALCEAFRDRVPDAPGACTRR